MFKAALIDMDGFLINSEELYLEANQLYFKKFNFTFTEDLQRQGTGEKFDEWITTIISLGKPGEEILKERNTIFFELARTKLKLLDGAEELLILLHHNFKTALVTSSRKYAIDLVFQKTGIEKYFDLLITGEMETHGKPDPQCYLTAAERLGITPTECVVFEDAPSGVLAGKNAGMKVVAVPSPYVMGDEAFKKADVVLDRLRQITLEKISS
jgi:HAD superfamily hydrolase (TIGR01509 family)